MLLWFEISRMLFLGLPKTLRCASLSKIFLECPLPTLCSNLVRLTLIPVNFYPGFYQKSFVLIWAWVTRKRFQIIALSNRSTKVWISYSNICVFMIVFILSLWTGSENVAIFLLFQMKMHLYNPRGALPYWVILGMCGQNG